MSSSGQVLEFLSWDDAWYDVSLDLTGENLTVSYKGFDESLVFDATAYGTPEKVEEMEKRFRPLSQQAQDRECSKVERGMTVCASLRLSKNTRHFYDGVVQEVYHREHSLANGEEECLCTFIIAWKHGPRAGNSSPAKIANICLIQPCGHTHPLLTSFLKMARRKFEMASCNFGSDSEGYHTCSAGSSRGGLQFLDFGQKSSVAQHAISELKCAMQPIVSEGMVVNSCEGIESDANMGGESSHHFVLVDNLEKGLAASTIVDFIQEQTSIASQAYVFPNLSLEPYTRGIIALDCKKKFEEVCCFLDSPNHIIASSGGRPWVTTGKVSTTDSMETLLLISQKQLSCESAGIGRHLKLVRSGIKDYDMATKRRELYIDFFNHLQGLEQALLSEDNGILKQSC